jgi:hypothetical protein
MELRTISRWSSRSILGSSGMNLWDADRNGASA